MLFEDLFRMQKPQGNPFLSAVLFRIQATSN